MSKLYICNRAATCDSAGSCFHGGPHEKEEAGGKFSMSCTSWQDCYPDGRDESRVRVRCIAVKEKE